jgi:hypothetical protein
MAEVSGGYRLAAGDRIGEEVAAASAAVVALAASAEFRDRGLAELLT